MNVGFFLNQVDNRGSGNAVFDYAHHNESLLKNKSIIFANEYGDRNPISLSRFIERFGQINFIRSFEQISNRGIDVLYHIKSGQDEGFRPPSSIRYAVHAVFNVEPHGDKYAAVSNWLANREIKVPFVPHIVDPVWSNEDQRPLHGIPGLALVIGRHGGYDTFDIPFVWDAIQRSIDRYPWIYYVFMNTEKKLEHERIIYLPEGGPLEKRLFLNMCDAMIHARSRGETFGIAVGEFAVLGKPVMTYSESSERAHIEELGDKGLYYSSINDILAHIKNLAANKVEPRFAYMSYASTGIMKKFKETFLD